MFDPTSLNPVAVLYVGTVNRADYIECFLHWRGLPRRWKIQQLHEMWFEGGTPLRIDLDS